MRACACDTASRPCVRSVLCRPAFLLVPPLPSADSAAACAALFAGFAGVESGGVGLTPCLRPLAQTARAVFPQAAFLRGRSDERGRDCSPPQRLLPRSGFPRCRRRVFRSANLSALPPCTHPFFDARRCHTARGLPPPTGLLGATGVVTRR